jgi:hypothetical protein
MQRRTALQTVERKAFGGSSYDSYSWASMFKTYKPFNLGVKSAQLFSTQLNSQLINKKFTYYTLAQKNFYLLPAGVDDYEWQLTGDADVDFRFTELLVSETDQSGKGNTTFKIAIDRDWLHEPAVIKLENSDLPLLKILGYPKQRSANSWEYEVEVQSGDPMAWIPATYLMPGMRAIRVSTAVSDESNYKFAGDQFGEMFKLQSWCGNFANKAEFTDKFLRMEIGAKDKKMAMPKGMGYSVGGGNNYTDGAIGVGHVFAQKFASTNSGKSEVIEQNVFISNIESRLMERTEMDREMNMEFGQMQKTKDRESGRTIKVAPGYRAIRKEGHYMEHNGNLSLSDIYEYVSNIFLQRRSFGDRSIKIATGEAGLEMLHRLIAAEASQFQYVDTQSVRDTTSPFHEYSKEYGYQFTKIRFPMGYVVEFVYDPIKDDRKLFPEKAPGTNRTTESFTLDIFDFGETDQKAQDANMAKNMCMVMQDGVEAYWHVSNVYDFNTGAIKDGSNANTNNKDTGIYVEKSQLRLRAA